MRLIRIYVIIIIIIIIYLFICFFLLLIFGIGNFLMHFCPMLTYVNVAKLRLFMGLHVSVIGQDENIQVNDSQYSNYNRTN